MLNWTMRPFWFLLAGLMLALAGCKVPTPPPSPTPWPTGTPTPTEAPAAAATPSATTPATGTPTPTPTPTRPPTALTIWENLSDAQAQALAEDVEAFQQAYPYYQVTLTHYAGAENFMAPLMAGQASFDLVLASPALLTSLWVGEQIAPMSDFFSPAVMDEFASVALAGATRNDRVWGLPDTAGFHLLLFYNRALVDRPPASTGALAELGQALTGANRWGLVLNSYDPLWVAPWLGPNGGWLTGADGRPTLNTPAMTSTLAMFDDWHNGPAAFVPKTSYEEARQEFLAGRAAMMIDGEWAILELGQTDKVDWAVARLPDLDEASGRQPAAPLVLARYWAVSRSATGNRALAAADFLAYITRPERQLAWTGRFGLLPTRRVALDNPAIIGNPALRASAEQLLAGRTVPLGANANALLNAMREPLQGLLDGRLTPVQAAEAMQMNTEQ